MKRNIVVYFLLIAAVAALGAQSLPPDDARLSAYEDWNATPWNSKVAYCNGALVGCWYVAAAYAWQTRDKPTPPISQLVPYGIMADDLARLIDAVYKDPANRKIPIIRIIVDWKVFNSRYGKGL